MATPMWGDSYVEKQMGIALLALEDRLNIVAKGRIS